MPKKSSRKSYKRRIWKEIMGFLQDPATRSSTANTKKSDHMEAIICRLKFLHFYNFPLIEVKHTADVNKLSMTLYNINASQKTNWMHHDCHNMQGFPWDVVIIYIQTFNSLIWSTNKSVYCCLKVQWFLRNVELYGNKPLWEVVEKFLFA